jgi:hypothetical protein
MNGLTPENLKEMSLCGDELEIPRKMIITSAYVCVYVAQQYRKSIERRDHEQVK